MRAPSFEAALYLCELLLGAEVARGIAGGLVIDWDLSAVRFERAATAASTR